MLFLKLIYYQQAYPYSLLLLSFQESGEKPETMSNKDAAMFPVIASCTLFGIYIFFKVINW